MPWCRRDLEKTRWVDWLLAFADESVFKALITIYIYSIPRVVVAFIARTVFWVTTSAAVSYNIAN